MQIVDTEFILLGACLRREWVFPRSMEMLKGRVGFHDYIAESRRASREFGCFIDYQNSES